VIVGLCVFTIDVCNEVTVTRHTINASPADFGIATFIYSSLFTTKVAQIQIMK